MRTPWRSCRSCWRKSPNAATRPAAGRREAFRAKRPPLVFDDYKLEGLKRAQQGVYPRFRAGGPPHAGHSAADGLRGAERQSLRGACRRRFHDGLPHRALRLRPGTLFVRGQVRHAAQFQDHRLGKHLLDGLQPGLYRHQLQEHRPRRAAVGRRPLPGADLHLGERSEAGRISTRGSRYSSTIPTISRSGISATAISATSPRSATPSRSRTARASFRRAWGCR